MPDNPTPKAPRDLTSEFMAARLAAHKASVAGFDPGPPPMAPPPIPPLDLPPGKTLEELTKEHTDAIMADFRKRMAASGTVNFDLRTWGK